ncbi:uncharacterized protein LOC144658372 [Oculina patagonica]
MAPCVDFLGQPSLYKNIHAEIDNIMLTWDLNFNPNGLKFRIGSASSNDNFFKSINKVYQYQTRLASKTIPRKCAKKAIWKAITIAAKRTHAVEMTVWKKRKVQILGDSLLAELIS